MTSRIGRTRKQWSRFPTSMLPSVPQRFPFLTLSKSTIWRWTKYRNKCCPSPGHVKFWIVKIFISWNVMMLQGKITIRNEMQDNVISTAYSSRTARRGTSMFTTTTHKRWWTGTTPSDAVNSTYCRFSSSQWCKVTRNWEWLCLSKNSNSHLTSNTWFRLPTPLSLNLNSLSI